MKVDAFVNYGRRFATKLYGLIYFQLYYYCVYIYVRIIIYDSPVTLFSDPFVFP